MYNSDVHYHMSISAQKRAIAFTYNCKSQKSAPSQAELMREAEFDEEEVIEKIIGELESLGVAVYPVEANEQAYSALQKLKGKIDMVFNFAEGLHGKDREAHIPAMLEMLEIPYTGGPPISYALALDKALCKEILAYHHIPTPKWQVMTNARDAVSSEMSFPLIVKPVAEGSSKGIYADSFVNTVEELAAAIARVSGEYNHRVLVEEYLDGREFTVAVLGTPFRALPIVEVVFDDLPPHVPKFDHYEAKWIYDSPGSGLDPLVCPAQISRELAKEIETHVLRASEALRLADWARFDIRLDRRGVPHILEVNCPPGILPDPDANSRFPRAAFADGLTYKELLAEVLNSCWKRYKGEIFC